MHSRYYYYYYEKKTLIHKHTAIHTADDTQYIIADYHNNNILADFHRLNKETIFAQPQTDASAQNQRNQIRQKQRA